MTNLTLFKGGNGDTKIALKGAKGMVNALKNSAADAGGGDLPEGGVYISFSGKQGRYSIGTDKDDADPNELWLVNIFEFQGGWMCWKGGSPVAKRFASIFEGGAEQPDMTEHGPFKESQGEGWARAKAMIVRSIDSGRQGYYSTSTKSAVREFAKLEEQIATRLDKQLPCWPIIQLEKEQFKAQGQTNWKPILHVAGWLGMAQVQEMAQMEDNETIVAEIERLVEEAAKMEEDGIPDTTLGGGNDEADEQSENALPDEDDGDGIPDAEIVEDEQPEEEVKEEVKPASTLRRAAAAKTGGLRRNVKAAG